MGFFATFTPANEGAPKTAASEDIEAVMNAFVIRCKHFGGLNMKWQFDYIHDRVIRVEYLADEHEGKVLLESARLNLFNHLDVCLGACTNGHYLVMAR
jgi:hypothetical protein